MRAPSAFFIRTSMRSGGSALSSSRSHHSTAHTQPGASKYLVKTQGINLFSLYAVKIKMIKGQPAARIFMH